MHRKEGKFLTGSITVSAWNGIAIWIKEPVTRQKLLMAPYRPGVVAQLVPPAPKGKAPAPVGASDHQWMASSESICSSIQEVFHCESDEAGCEHWKRLLRSYQRRSVLSADGVESLR